jgi:hypothetical protein
VVNYQLNYMLLASIPESLEDEIYKGLGYKVETISTIDLLKQIKRVVVTWAVEHAQRSEVEKMPVKEVAEYTMGEAEDKEIVQIAVEDSGTGGQKGGTIEKIPKPIVHEEVAQFARGDSKEESEGEGGQEGGAIDYAATPGSRRPGNSRSPACPDYAASSGRRRPGNT